MLSMKSARRQAKTTNKSVISSSLSSATRSLAVSSAADPASTGAEKPNILFILVDDMGYSDLGCYGSEINTPNIDSLAKNGLRFTQMYNTAKCMPSRACLLTGVYAQQCDMDRRPKAIKNAVTLGEVLRPAGYRTLASGNENNARRLVSEEQAATRGR